MTDVHLADDAHALAVAKAHDAGLSLGDWLTHAVVTTAATEHRGPEIPFDDGGFPSVVYWNHNSARH